VVNPTKAKIFETMAPTSTLKRRKVSPTRGVKKTKGGTGQRRTPADTDSAANSSESEDEAGDSVEVVKKVTKNTGRNLTPAASGGQLQIKRNDTVGTL
jgi:hypothetical protein